MANLDVKIIRDVLIKCDLKATKGIYEIPAAVKAISETAFSNTEGVTAIVIHNELNDIKAATFDVFRNLEEFRVPDDHPAYTVQDGIVFNKDMSEVMFVPAKLQKESYTVPDTVVEIGTAFAKCEGIKELTLGKGIIKLGEYSISEWEHNAKKIVTVPPNVQNIHEDAFGFRPSEIIACIKGEPASVAEEFAKKNDILFWDISQPMDSVTQEEIETYKIKDNDTGVTLIKYLGSSKALKLPEYILGKKLTAIGSCAFQGEGWEEVKFDSITIPETVSILEANAFDLVYIGKLIVPQNVTHINNKCFGDYDFYLEDTVVTVDRDSAMDRYLSEYKPNVIKTYNGEDISEDAMASLKCLEFSEEQDGSVSARYTSKWDVETVKKLVVPDSFNGRRIESFDFAVRNLGETVESLYLPKTIVNIELSKFVFAESLKELVIDEENPYYWTDGKGLYTKDKKVFLRLCDFSIPEYTVVSGSVTIDTYAFAACERLTKVVLPETIRQINKFAFGTEFGGCKMLDEIINIDLVTEMDPKALMGTGFQNKQDEVIAGKTLVKYSDINSRSYTVPETVTCIAAKAFYVNGGDDLLEEVVIPNTVTVLGEGAFIGRKKLKTIVLSEYLETLPDNTFAECHSLVSITIPKSVCEISQSAFPINEFDYSGGLRAESALAEIKVDPENRNFTAVDGVLYSKDMKRLIYCPRGISKNIIQIPDGVETICEFAFAGIPNILEVKLSDSVRVLEPYAFYNCGKLSKVILSRNLKTIGASAFGDCNLDTVSLPEGLNQIGANAFAGCNISRIVVPKTVERVEHEAFSGCPDITIYDTIEPNGEDCYCKIDDLNGYPNSEVGFMGVGKAHAMWQCAANHKWMNHVITVRSAESDEIKYRVLMEADSSQRQYYCILTSGWGHNASFAFREVDKFFDKIKGANYKLRLALSRLKYKFDLDSEYEKKYFAYITKNGKAAVKLCVDNDDHEMLQLCADTGAIKKSNITELIKYANEKCNVAATAFLMEYKQRHLK